MKKTLNLLMLILFLAPLQKIASQNLASDIPYMNPASEEQYLDIYTPANAQNLPIVFWIHGGGWQTGDKTNVNLKPRVFTEHGFVFVSTNYRLLPNVVMDTLIQDVARSLGWVHKNIVRYGGDPSRIFVMGHSAGAQLAALLCTDDQYMKEQGVPFSHLRGCVPVDGDTYDLPAIIMTEEVRCAVHGMPQPNFGHRVKFGNDPQKHIEFSAVTHVAKDKGIPPFLLLYFTGNPYTTAQARRFGAVLKEAGIPVRIFGEKDETHVQLNDNLGLPDDPPTMELFRFLEPLIGAK